MNYGDYSSKSNIFSYFMDSEESSSPSKDLAEIDPGHSGSQNDIFPIKSSPTSSPLNPNSFDYPSLNQAPVDASLSIQQSIPRQTDGEFRPLYDRSQLPVENNLDSRVSSLSVSVHISGGMTPPQPTQSNPSQPTILQYSLPTVPLNPPQTLTSYSSPPFVWNTPQPELHEATFPQRPSQATMHPHTINIHNTPSPQPQPDSNNRPLPNSFSTQFTIHLPQFVQSQLYPSQETMHPHTINIHHSPSPQPDPLNAQQNPNSYSTKFTINFPPFIQPSTLPPLQQMMNPPAPINPLPYLEPKKLATHPSPPIKPSFKKTSYPKKDETKFVIYDPQKNYPSKNLGANKKSLAPSPSIVSESIFKVDLTTLSRPCKICKTESFQRKYRIKISDLNNNNSICNICHDVAKKIIKKLSKGSNLYIHVPPEKIKIYTAVYEYLVDSKIFENTTKD